MKFIALLLLILPAFAGAQNTDRKIENDPNARALLDQVSAKYHSLASVKLKFSLIVDMPDDEADVKQEGVVYLKKEKYKIDTDEMLIICDNVKRYIYYKGEVNEAQINYFDPDDGEIESPSKLFDIYKENYYYRIGGEVTDSGRKLTLITLLPVDAKNSPYKMIFLYVDKTIQQIVKAEIRSKDGIKYTYAILSMEETAVIDDAEFTFDPSRYPGIYVDDMTK